MKPHHCLCYSTTIKLIICHDCSRIPFSFCSCSAPTLPPPLASSAISTPHLHNLKKPKRVNKFGKSTATGESLVLLSQIRENEIRELSGDYDETAVVVASDLRTDDGGEIADGSYGGWEGGGGGGGGDERKRRR
ncbi:unnamed protein product [Brassica napus]|uniref:(rape) hypothetical protein n=1 Tax=Brassica napus TaxID=3708 RepID=A0A816KFI0_BRANA|nr:unnamed protein product [Brassica napus]